jgi:hypothetical protein
VLNAAKDFFLGDTMIAVFLSGAECKCECKSGWTAYNTRLLQHVLERVREVEGRGGNDC